MMGREKGQVIIEAQLHQPLEWTIYHQSNLYIISAANNKINIIDDSYLGRDGFG